MGVEGGRWRPGGVYGADTFCGDTGLCKSGLAEPGVLQDAVFLVTATATTTKNYRPGAVGWPASGVGLAGSFGLALCLSFAAFALAAGQGAGSGSIRGTAVDTSGKLIPGVEIAIVDLNRVTRTTAGGWFVLDSVPAGAHQLRARRSGFEFVSRSLE